MALPRLLLALTMALLVAACQGFWSPPVEVAEPVAPLSKVYVQNATPDGYHVRMNWPDGFVQVSWIDAGTTQGLTGAIGTSGFPATIDVLTADCAVAASLPGLPAGRAGIVVVSQRGATLHDLHRADASWTMAGSIQACGATPVD